MAEIINKIEGILNINLDSMGIIQGYALGNLIILIVILTRVFSISVYLFNGYNLEKYEIEKKAPRLFA